MLWQAAKPITKINIEQFNIGKADNSKLNTQNSTLRIAQPFNIQHSTFNIPYTSSPANFTLNPNTVANIISISFQNE